MILLKRFPQVFLFQSWLTDPFPHPHFHSSHLLIIQIPSFSPSLLLRTWWFSCLCDNDVNPACRYMHHLISFFFSLILILLFDLCLWCGYLIPWFSPQSDCFALVLHQSCSLGYVCLSPFILSFFVYPCAWYAGVRGRFGWSETFLIHSNLFLYFHSPHSLLIWLHFISFLIAVEWVDRLHSFSFYLFPGGYTTTMPAFDADAVNLWDFVLSHCSFLSPRLSNSDSRYWLIEIGSSGDVIDLSGLLCSSLSWFF